MTPQVRLATLLAGSPAIAEAVVQEAFASVRERWADLERPDAHLRTSVVNGCTGILRRRTIEQRYRAARIEVADSELPEQLIDLRGALDRLTDRQRLNDRSLESRAATRLSGQVRAWMSSPVGSKSSGPLLNRRATDGWGGRSTESIGNGKTLSTSSVATSAPTST